MIQETSGCSSNLLLNLFISCYFTDGVIACINLSTASFPDFEVLPEFFSHGTEPSVLGCCRLLLESINGSDYYRPWINDVQNWSEDVHFHYLHICAELLN